MVAFSKMQAEQNLNWIKEYAALKTQINLAKEMRLNYINTCLCDFDMVNSLQGANVSSIAKRTFTKLEEEGFFVLLLIKNEIHSKEDKYNCSFAHIRWSDSLSFKFQLLTKKEPWKKDIPDIFYKEYEVNIKEEITKEPVEQEENNDVKPVIRPIPFKLREARIKLVRKQTTQNKQKKGLVNIFDTM